ncbi:estradiol 17-beta-dehydrogenase 8-like [Oppia nitens]|uniref:estradiol 17-beta-dehydrogenase 8-like n=1 Tax=Oppia nitens TaxID=1686743 RepID=UPI0023DBF0C7|nr:estradiol 17-beta-dehydrogenase 8-like [Oppia nitens]
MFANRIALITGGGSGIGRAVANILAKESASIVIADQSINGANETKQLIESQVKSGVKHLSLEVDVSQMDSLKRVFKAINENYDNRVATLLVNCAGITRDQMMTKLSEQDFDKVIAVNLKGTFMATQLFCQQMIENKQTDGSVVNVSSVSAKLGNIGQSNYNASKAGVEALTRTAAQEMAKFNIRVNVVMPGFINTPIVQTIPQKVLDQLISNIPLRRQGKPEEVGEAIAFLLSPKSSYITGTILQVSGGLAL